MVFPLVNDVERDRGPGTTATKAITCSVVNEHKVSHLECCHPRLGKANTLALTASQSLVSVE